MAHSLRDGKLWTDTEPTSSSPTARASRTSPNAKVPSRPKKDIDMSSTRNLADREASIVSKRVSTSLTLTHLGASVPAALRLPLIITISYIFGTVSHEIAAAFIGSADLRTISTHTVSTDLVLLSLGYRALELSVAYFAGLDALDASILSFLTHTPQSYLLNQFYYIPLANTTATLILTTLSTFVPFALIYRTSPLFSSLLQRLLPLNGLVSLNASVILGAWLLLNQYTWLPTFLVLHFDKLRTIESAHNGNLIYNALFLAPAGFLTASFFFAPLASPLLAALERHAQLHATQTPALDPAETTLLEQLADNFAFARKYTPRAQELLKRAALLVVMTFASTAAKAAWEIEGNDATGAVVWALSWATGVLLTGLGLGWIGGVVQRFQADGFF